MSLGFIGFMFWVTVLDLVLYNALNQVKTNIFTFSQSLGSKNNNKWVIAYLIL